MTKFFDNAKKAIEAYEQQQFFGKMAKAANKMKNTITGVNPLTASINIGNAFGEGLKEGLEKKHFSESEMNKHLKDFNEQPAEDPRYKTPKRKYQATEEQIDEAIEYTEIYKQAKERILKFQRGQIGYGIDKYPETLNPNTWTEIETQHHIIEESIDKLHYEVMRLLQLEKRAEKELEEFKKNQNKATKALDDFRKEWETSRPGKVTNTVDTNKDPSQFAQYLIDLNKLETRTLYADGKPYSKVWLDKEGNIVEQMILNTSNQPSSTEVYDAHKKVSKMIGADTDGDYGDMKKSPEYPKPPKNHMFYKDGYLQEMTAKADSEKFWVGALPGADIDGDVVGMDDKFDALAYSYGQLGKGPIPKNLNEKIEALMNSGKTVNEIRKEMFNLEPIVADPKTQTIHMNIHVDSKIDSQAIAKEMQKTLDKIRKLPLK